MTLPYLAPILTYPLSGLESLVEEVSLWLRERLLGSDMDRRGFVELSCDRMRELTTFRDVVRVQSLIEEEFTILKTKSRRFCNRKHSFQLFVGVLYTCSVSYQLVSPSFAHATPT